MKFIFKAYRCSQDILQDSSDSHNILEDYIHKSTFLKLTCRGSYVSIECERLSIRIENCCMLIQINFEVFSLDFYFEDTDVFTPKALSIQIQLRN